MDFRTPMLELWAYQKGGNDMNKKQENDPKKEMIMDIFDDQTGEKLKRYKYLNQFIVQGQILFVGSSLMEQFPINELQQTLDKKFIIYNRGVSGFVTEELLSVMDTCIFELVPSQIFINIGTNDIASPNYKRKDLIANYDRILREIKDRLPDCEVYVMAYYPVNPKARFPSVDEAMRKDLFNTRTNTTLQKANMSIKELALNYHYKFIDVNEGLVDTEGNLKEEYTVEGIHLWPNAYARIFKNLKQYLYTP